MSTELLHLYQDLYKLGRYFYRNLEKPGLQLLVINKPMINSIYEFRVPEVRRQFLLYLFRPEDVQSTLSQIELRLRQLPVIQYRGKKPSSSFSTL